MVGRIFQALIAGWLTYLSLGVFPYFPQGWVLTFSLLIALLSYWFIKSAIFAALAAFGLSLLYHSPGLFTLYFFFVAAAAVLSVKLPDFAKIILLVVAAPHLASLNIAGHALPLEFLVIFLAPAVLSNRLAAVTACAACFACCVAGIIGQQELVGNVIVGIPIYKFFSLNAPPHAPFYNLAWLKDVFTEFDISNSLLIAIKVFKFTLYQPMVFLQTVAWGIIASLLSLLVTKRKWQFDLAAAVAGISLVILLEFIALTLYPEKIDFSFTNLALRAAAAMLAAFIFWKTKKFFPEDTVAAGETIEEEPGENADEDTITPAARSQAVPKIKELTLEESLKMQKNLQEYINRKFVHEVTALDIDVADSAKLKSGEAGEDVLVAFRNYWKIVDGAVERRRGKILTRSGDGAIYIFQTADQAVVTAQEILNEINRFNKSGNTLKSEFRVRQGINTGKIVVDTSRPDTEIFSSVLDIAGHLQKMADPGSILISENTYRQIRSKKEFIPGGICEKDHIPTYTLKKKEPNQNISW